MAKKGTAKRGNDTFTDEDHPPPAAQTPAPAAAIDDVFASAPVLAALSEAGIDPSVFSQSADDQIDAFIVLSQKAKRLKAEMDSIDDATARMQEPLKQWFAEKGQSAVTRRGATVYLSREFWPAMADPVKADGGAGPESDVDAEVARVGMKAALVKALKKFKKTTFLVEESFNWTSLRSVVLRDFERDAEDTPIVPKPLVGLLKVSERINIKVRKGS